MNEQGRKREKYVFDRFLGSKRIVRILESSEGSSFDVADKTGLGQRCLLRISSEKKYNKKNYNMQFIINLAKKIN